MRERTERDQSRRAQPCPKCHTFAGMPIPRCVVCGKSIADRRADAKTCGAKCRRRRGVGVVVPLSSAAERNEAPASQLSDEQLLSFIEQAAAGGSWTAAKFLLERSERIAAMQPTPSPLEDFFADIERIPKRRPR